MAYWYYECSKCGRKWRVQKSDNRFLFPILGSVIDMASNSDCPKCEGKGHSIDKEEYDKN